MGNGEFFDLIVGLSLFFVVHLFVAKSALKNNDKESWIVEVATVVLGFACFLIMLLCYGYFYDGNFVIWGNNRESTATLVALIAHIASTGFVIYKFNKNKKKKSSSK